MINLVGEKGFHGPVIYQGMDDLLNVFGLHVHLYGKGNKTNAKDGTHYFDRI